MIIEARADTITLKGNMKSNIWPAIQAAAALLLDNHPTGIIIDASGLDEVTAEGGVTFVEAFNYIGEHNARIVVTGLNEDTLEIIQQVPGVRSQIPLALNIEEARDSLALEEITPQRGKARIAALVPLVGKWDRAIFHAERYAAGENCEIHLLQMIKVPRNLPLGTPMPEHEAECQQKLDQVVEMVKKDRVSTFGHIERVRSYRDGTAAFVKALDAGFVVLSIDQTRGDSPFIEEYKGLEMLEVADYELSIVKSLDTQSEAVPRHVVVPTVGEWKHALEHACKLTTGESSTVTVVYLVTVPRSQAIDAELPDIEPMISDAAKEATRIARRYGVKVDTRVERVRQATIAFIRMLEPMKADLVVIGMGENIDMEATPASAIAEELMRNTVCETVFLKTVPKPLDNSRATR